MSIILSFAPYAFGATYSISIGSQATVIGYIWDEPQGLVFLGIPYAQAPIGQNRFAVSNRRLYTVLLHNHLFSLRNVKIRQEPFMLSNTDPNVFNPITATLSTKTVSISMFLRPEY